MTLPKIEKKISKLKQGLWSDEDDESVKRRSGMAGDENCGLSDQLDQWQKGEILGRGSFGPVYEGIGDGGYFFAVKEVSLLDQDDEGKQRILQLEQGIALLSQFKHENIVQYYGTKKDESKLYIFLELVTKGSLLSHYQKFTLQDSQVWSYTRQILHGLKYLHDRNVVHGDIRCANVLVDTNGSVKLADFGLAKASKLNDVKSYKGTPFWMAPEVVRSLGYGLPADIWSLGCTVLEMLTGRFPYSNLDSQMAALFRIGRGERPAIPESLSNDARDFILKCLQVDPSLRPTAAELLDHPFVVPPLLPPSTSSGFSNIHLLCGPSPLPPPEKVFGRYFEEKILLSKLLYSDKKETQLSTVPVLGVCGIGKTTLARLVYEDGAVKEHFQLRAWVNVHGPELKLHLAAQGILKCAMGMSCSVDDMDELDEMVRDVLNSNRCLIVFDDIHSMGEDSWLHMNEKWFGFVDLGSRVLITTPNKVVANLVATESPIVLSRLSMDDSLSLLRHLSFGFSESTRDMSESLAQIVASLCQGLPLLLKLVVSQIKFDDNLSNRLSSDGISSTNLNESAVAMMCVLALPPHLREFLAYCSFFAQEYAMDKEKIIRMWSIFYGFVMMSSPTNDARLEEEEDIGESYLLQLLNRSFFKDITCNGYGDITDFQVPGLIHKAPQDVADISLVQGRLGVIGSIDENDGLLSIVLPSSGEYYSAQRLRVLLFSPIVYPGGSSLDHSLVEFKSLKSLDLRCSGIRDVSDDIGGLRELWYLNLSYTLIESIPESIAELSELRTLDLSWCFHLKILPKGMCKLTHMRHLDLARCESLSYLPSGIELLTSLHSMPLFVLGEDHGCAGLAELGTLNYLRGRLEIRKLENVRKDSEAKDAKLDLKNIHHLRLSWSQSADNCYKVLKDLKPHENLQGFDVTNYMGSIFPKWMEHLNGLIKISINNCGCEALPSLGQLPYLKDLQLKGMNNLRYIDQVFHGDAGVHGHIFPSLEKFGLYDLPVLVKWEFIHDFGSTDKCAFPSIKFITIQGCHKLPGCPSLPTLTELIVCDGHFMVLYSLDRLTSLSSLLIKDMELDMLLYNLRRLRSLKKLILFNIKDRNLGILREQDAFVSLEHLGILHCHSLETVKCPIATSLQKLHIKDCQNLEIINFSREYHVLFELVVEDCPQLVTCLGMKLPLFCSLRKVIIKNCGVFNAYLGYKMPEKLEYLFIGGCPEFESNLLTRTEDISHIPCVILNNRKVKYEDNKHFEGKGKLLPTGISHNYSNGGADLSTDDTPLFSGDILPTQNLKIYTYSDLESATRNFRADNVLGVGGYGNVYKGWVDKNTLLPSKPGTGIAVAIKKYWNHESVQGFDGCLSEVNFLGRLSHPNLVKLLGYCWEDKNLLLVYEFMPKGSLQNHLFQRVTEPLPWDFRLKISIGVAKGLAFLHTSDKKIIYRDFKSSNILLDENYNAKISYFCWPSGGDSHGSVRVWGTYDYASPEYIVAGHLHVESDVYGFGMVLLEMLTGLRACERNLVAWKKPLLSQRRNLKDVMDARIEGQYSTMAAIQTAQLTLKCLEPEARKRPSMKEVLDVLLQIAAMDKPKESKSRSTHFSSHHHTTVGAVVGAIIEVEVVIENLLTISQEQISLRVFKDDLETLKKSFSMVHDFLHDAEKIQVNESSVKRWLRDLDARAFDAHNVLAEINYQLVSKKVGATRKKTAKEKVQYFFSNYNPIVYRLRLRRRIQEINEKLESINQQAMGFGLQNTVAQAPVYGSDASASMETNLFSDERSMSQEY